MYEGVAHPNQADGPAVRGPDLVGLAILALGTTLAVAAAIVLTLSALATLA
jgi:hypothetical protein